MAKAYLMNEVITKLQHASEKLGSGSVLRDVSRATKGEYSPKKKLEEAEDLVDKAIACFEEIDMTVDGY